MHAIPEIEQAQDVQARLLRPRGPRLQSLEYAGRCLQARRVGGDTFDFIDAGPGRMLLAVGDVAGKGMAAALVASALHATLRARYENATPELLDVLAAINRQLVESTAPQHYATLFLGEFDDASGRLRYVNSGHVAPLIVRDGNSVERLDSTAVPLGMFDDWKGRPATVTLEPGDTLLLFSDGVTEMANDADEEFGEGRLVESVRALRRLSPALLVDVLLSRCRRFGRQLDDMTLVAARARGVAA